ncbi:MAG: type II toxin-antitoxin system VapC family toxin [Candidatus Micrarchaeota archaeon]|nr:type II toxin-antitoxin system VapC family toxin [Candidatus Micrarchaeota archaeon]
MEENGGRQRPTIVLDASVITKLFIEEDYTDIAEKIVEKYIAGEVDLFTTQVSKYEVFNSIKYSEKFNVGMLPRIFSIFDSLDFLVSEEDPWMAPMSLMFAMQYGLTVYDASYVALAHVQKATLYTADNEIVRNVGQPFVKHIREFA